MKKIAMFIAALSLISLGSFAQKKQKVKEFCSYQVFYQIKFYKLQ